VFPHIFGLCKQLQTICLDRRGIDCLVDDGGIGRLPEMVSRMLGFMVCELLRDASALAIAPRILTVTLRRRGDVCLCAISRLGGSKAGTAAHPGLSRVRRLADALDGACMIRSMLDRGTVAVMFDARLVEPRLPAAVQWYRREAAGWEPVAHPAVRSE
jgi:hypothetical protein